MLNSRRTAIAVTLASATLLATPRAGDAQKAKTDTRRAAPAKSTPTKKGYVTR